MLKYFNILTYFIVYKMLYFYFILYFTFEVFKKVFSNAFLHKIIKAESPPKHHHKTL